jgi:hypothetical protein
MSVRESIALAVDDSLLRELDSIAKARGITRHEAARICLRLGVELAQRRLGPAQLDLIGRRP